MIVQNILYILLAAFGLGVLVFIHELGHYFMARKVGMTIEAFGIGFGKPLYSWEHKGVKWNLCMLPFGGYVRIAGMEKKGNLEPYQIPDGFYGKKPWERIQVALAGPIVNIAFAFLLFLIIWVGGGRIKSFSEFTHLIGLIDPSSKLYEMGVRPGDEIQEYDHRPFHGFNDLKYAALTDGKTAQIKGLKIDYLKRLQEMFDYTLPTYPNPEMADPSILTIGVLSPASFLIYNPSPSKNETLLKEGTPMAGSGIQPKDRILWVDGQLVFSQAELSGLINEPKALLRVKRGDKEFLTRIPRLRIADLRVGPHEKAEFDDWQHEAQLKMKVDELFFIPYNLTHDGVIENAFTYIDENSQETTHQAAARSPIEMPLLPGDQVIAVDGIPISSAVELLATIQKRHVQIIVQRLETLTPLSWKEEDPSFFAGVDWTALQQMIQTIGTPSRQKSNGPLRLLEPVIPRPLAELPLTDEQQEWLSNKDNNVKKMVEEIEDPEKRKEAMRQLEKEQKRVRLGLFLQDRQVVYNPLPTTLFVDGFKDVWRTLSALFTGMLSPKWMAGPVGIVQVIHYGWTVGIKEAFFWMAVISLNLGILNLLPIPVLDGGHICFSLYEGITKKRIKAKTMEWLIIPFVVLIILLFVYLTFQDLSRLFSRFF